MMKRLEASMFITYQRLALNKFFFVLVLIAHWLACIWAMTLVLVDETDGVPRRVDDFRDLEQNVGVYTKDSTWKLYVASLYFSTATITSVGYGDVAALNVVERFVCIVMLFIAGVSWACVLGQVSSIVGSMDSYERDFQKLMDDLTVMMVDRGLPKTVRQRIRTFFLSTKEAQRQAHHQKLLSRMSRSLQGEVALTVNRGWITPMSKVGFLRGLLPPDDQASADTAPPFMIDMALAMTSKVYAPAVVFGNVRELYILN